MKKSIVLLSLTTLMYGSTAFAGDGNPLQVRCYEADGVVTYHVTGCVPRSDISFYSQIGGGEMLQQVAVNSNGTVNVAWGGKIPPAFVLNVLDVNAAGIAGSGMVSFTGDKEFIINTETITNAGGNATIGWKAAVAHTDNYVFDVLKSVNGSDYAVVQTVKAQGYEISPYTFTDVTPTNGNATYQIRVRDIGNEVYYTSNPLFTDGVSGVSIYPTVAHTTINVRLDDNLSNGSYKVINMQGQVITSGVLDNSLYSLPVAQLPAGSYLIKVTNKGATTTQKFVKE